MKVKKCVTAIASLVLSSRQSFGRYRLLLMAEASSDLLSQWKLVFRTEESN